MPQNGQQGNVFAEEILRKRGMPRLALSQKNVRDFRPAVFVPAGTKAAAVQILIYVVTASSSLRLRPAGRPFSELRVVQNGFIAPFFLPSFQERGAKLLPGERFGPTNPDKLGT